MCVICTCGLEISELHAGLVSPGKLSLKFSLCASKIEIVLKIAHTHSNRLTLTHSPLSHVVSGISSGVGQLCDHVLVAHILACLLCMCV